jgi:hypothetical protein
MLAANTRMRRQVFELESAKLLPHLVLSTQCVAGQRVETAFSSVSQPVESYASTIFVIGGGLLTTKLKNERSDA